MGLYRGAGGSGDAVNDASSEALITLQARDAALAAQAAAEAARDAALLAETNAETAETNAETAETNAETAETNAAASASAASTSASNAASSASSASTSASNASTSASNAAASESAASTHASDALSSATNAAASAVAASTSAANAESSASDALAAQLAAEAALDQFDDTYLGAKSSNPTVDNDGNALSTGDLYFNTVANELRIWNGSSWQAASTVGGTVSSLTVTGAFAANGSTTIGDAAGDSVTINASTVSTPNGISFNGTSIPASKTLVVTTDIGSTVQAYDADTAKYDDVTANFIGTLQNGGSNVVVDSDIGVTVQAYDAQLADVAGLTPADNNFIVGNGTNFVTESGSTARTSLGLGSIATQDANNVAVTGGSINGTTVGASTASTGAFTTLSATGDVTIADKIVHSGDADTAVRFPAADTVTVETGGAERLRITSTGDLGVGTGSPAQKLDVTSSSTDSRIYIHNSTTGGTAGDGLMLGSISSDAYVYQYENAPLIFGTNASERMRIDSSGDLLVGATSSLYGFSGRKIVQINGSSESWVALTVGGSAASYLRHTGDDFLVANTKAGNLRFDTANSERMRIDSSGNVGIGTSSPTNFTNYKTLALNGTSGGVLELQNNGTSTGLIFCDNQLVTIRGNTSTPIVFQTNGGNERMRIDSSGNVGIGTSSPTSKLDVNGTATAKQAIIADGANGSVQFGSTSTYNIVGGVDNGGLRYNLPTGLDHQFRINASDVMRITSAGNVGIGTSNPSVYNAQLVSYKGTGVGTYLGHSNSGTFPKVSAIGLGSDAVAFTHTSSGSSYALYGSAQIAAIQSASSNATTDMAFYTTSGGSVTERMRIDSSGNVLVGTTSDDGNIGASSGANTYTFRNVDGARIAHDGSSYWNRFSDGVVIYWRRAGTSVGSISVSSTSTTYSTSSDYRLKENIAPMTGALDKVAQLKPVNYNWKVDGSAGQGFIAHELAEVCPDAVSGEKDAIDAEGNPVYQGVDTSFLVATLTAAIQEQQAIINELKTRIETLENK